MRPWAQVIYTKSHVCGVDETHSSHSDGNVSPSFIVRRDSSATRELEYLAEIGARFEALLPGIIAFRAPIRHVVAKFKLGQNERLDVLREAMCAMESEESHALAAAMREANAKRLSASEV